MDDEQWTNFDVRPLIIAYRTLGDERWMNFDVRPLIIAHLTFPDVTGPSNRRQILEW
jgi:hypothetical protein